MAFDSFDIKSLIRPVIDFPSRGDFRDITPLFQSPTALRLVMDSFAHRYVEADFTHIGAMDARGFLIGSVLAYQLNKPLVLFRKQGKLPADVCWPKAMRPNTAKPSGSARRQPVRRRFGGDVR
jgi:adenine phosphoribosyltransferase